MKKKTAVIHIQRYILLSCCIILAMAVLLPSTAFSQETEKKTVRVGWYESSFYTTSTTGRRSGYAYEYQMKVAAYTGWEYEYVHGSWSELLQMLIDGEIDLMSDISYTEEREKLMLYSSLPMGAEEYSIFITPENREITAEDFSTLNGKKIGVNKSSFQADQYRSWAKAHGVEAELVELTCSEDDSLKKLRDGELDAYVTMNAFKVLEHLVTVCEIGSSDFYFAVSKDRPDLLADLNGALARIQEENRNYNGQLAEKYLTKSGSNAFLDAKEEEWVADHGPIRVGYQDNYLAFCATDPETGGLTGALKDYLDYASYCMVNAHLEFETYAYPTVSAAVEALKKGEIDCVFPANLSGYDGEELDIVITPAMMRSDVYAVIRQRDQAIFGKKEHVIVAVNEGNPNYDAFLLDNYPDWRTVYFKDSEACIEAVGDGVADCLLISSYRYNNIARSCEKNRLTTFSTGKSVDYCFAVNEGESDLYAIMARIGNLVPASSINAALSYYITEDARLSFADILVDNLPVVLIVIGIILVVILILLVRSIRAEKRAERLISATEIDGLTGLYNRDYFLEYALRLYREHPEKHRDAIVLNIEQFHSVNAVHGREFGDYALQILGYEIRRIAQSADGIAGRFEADRFDMYCCPQKGYQEILDYLQGQMDGLAPDTSIRLRMGVMPWHQSVEPVQLFDRARTACSMARGHYKEHLIIFDEEMRRREIYEQGLQNDLRRALDNYEFEVHYQPKYDIQSDPPRLVSAEALIRWRHPELGMIAPDDFIPLFERNGQIAEVDKYVWSEAARQITRWREDYGVLLPVSVNLSRVDVFDPELENTLDSILNRYGLNPDALKLEVTESAYTENADEVIRVVESLRAKGYQVEMDDFGTGYSSLNMLSAMPVDVLKMDRAFIRDIEHNEKDVQLVALIIGTARNLKIPVVAEGVETRGQLELLKNLGCQIAQGYYFSPPLHPSEFETEVLGK